MQTAAESSLILEDGTVKDIPLNTVALLGDNDGTVIGYRNGAHAEEGHYDSFSVVRAKWDRWCAEQAEAAGAFIVPETLVESLIIEEGKVVGVKTEQE